MARALLTFVVLACFLPLARGAVQESRAREVEQLRESCQRGTDEWFRYGFELVEAELNVDVRKAVASADSLCEDAKSSSTPGVRATALAYAALAHTLLEGVTPTTSLRSPANAPPDEDSPPAIRAAYSITRSRQYCVERLPFEEFMSTLAARDAAEQSGDSELIARARLLVHHTSSDIGLETAQHTLAAAQSAIHGLPKQHLASRLAYEQHLMHSLEGDYEAAGRDLDEAERLARDEGNPRIRAAVEWRRGISEVRGGELLKAVEHFESAYELAAQLNDLVLQCQMLQFAADATLRGGDLDAAEEWLARSEALSAGRGLAEIERGQHVTRFDLAVARHDSQLAEELSQRIEQEGSAASLDWQRYIRLREQVRKAEAERSADEAALAAEQARAAELKQRAWAVGAVVAIVALAVLALTVLRSRRQLLRMNERLRAQIVRADEAKLAHDELQARMRRLERTESLGLMASGIAHDFNNLLTSILGGAELLTLRPLDEESRRLAQLIGSTSEQAARLCRQLQLYAGDSATELVPIDLRRLVLDVQPVLEASSGGKVEIVTDVGETAVDALGDRTELEQVLLNLVLNARDAQARQVIIRVRRTTGAPSAAERDDGECVLLEVADDGAGMPPDVVARIFDPFFTTRFPGRGLGLAVVHGVVSRHNGRIEVDSEPSRGTRFTIRLPLAAQPAPALPAPKSTTLEGRRATALVVDDEPGVRRILREMLELLGHVVHEFEHGASAAESLGALQVQGPLLVFVDLTMPDADGPETLRALRALRRDASFILTSGHPDSYVDEIARSLQPDAVLSKPFNLDRVREAVASVLANARDVIRP